MEKKDQLQDKEIKSLKTKLKEIMDKYLKKRKKETKDKAKYNKIKKTIKKKGESASSKSEIEKLINMLKQGVVSGSGRIGPTQPIVQQIPATVGTIQDRIASAQKKKDVGDPFKEWRDLKNTWVNVKDKYNNDTLSTQDIKNIYEKAKKFGGTIQDNSLLAMNTIISMYGTGKAAYDYLKRYMNRNRPSTENVVTVDDLPQPSPSPSPPSPSPPSPSPSPPSPSPPSPSPINEELPPMRGEGLQRFATGNRDMISDPNAKEFAQPWSDYLKETLQSGLNTAGALGLGTLYLSNRLREGFRERQQNRDPAIIEDVLVRGGRQIAGLMGNLADQALRNVGAEQAEQAEQMRNIAQNFAQMRERARFRERGREQDLRQQIGQFQQRLQQPLREARAEADGVAIEGYRPPDAVGGQRFDLPRDKGELKLPRGMKPETALQTGRIPGTQSATAETRQGSGIEGTFSDPQTFPSAGRNPLQTEPPQETAASRFADLSDFPEIDQ